MDYTNISRMKYYDYEIAFSTARLNKYLAACDGNCTKALSLYRHNVKLCQKFYGVLNVFEIVFRNAINNHYIVYFNDSNWIKNQLKVGGMLENHPQRLAVQKIIMNLVDSGKYTNDRVVSSVSLGFWTHLFTKSPFLRGGQTLLKIFPNKTKGLGQKYIHNELRNIKNFRNRIAHHEAICFDAHGKKNICPTLDNYMLICKYIHFLGYSENQLLYGFNVLPDSVINNIDRL